MLNLSAQSEKSLRRSAADYAELLKSQPDRLADICYAASTDRTHHPIRASIRVAQHAADNADDSDRVANVVSDLGRIAEGKKSGSICKGHIEFRGGGRVAFLGTGQGAQYSEMGQRLYRSDAVFRDVIDRCDEVLEQLRGQSLCEVMFDPDRSELLDHTAWTQPALYALEMAMATRWMRWGVRPVVTMGHSVGQYAAAAVAGVFSLEDGLRLIARRGELMGDLPAGGGMAVAFADGDAVRSILDMLGGDVEIAAFNGPSNTTLTGPLDAIQAAIDSCDRAGIKTQKLNVSHAFHSRLMEPMLDAFESFAADIPMIAPEIPVVCNITGEPAGDEIATASYWRDHIRRPVMFTAGIDAVAAEGVDAMIEIGPTPSLLAMIRRGNPDVEAVAITSMRSGNDDVETLSAALAQYHVAGGNVDWSAVFDDASVRYRRIDLPAYPFDHKRYWLESELPTRERLADVMGTNIAHPLIGKPIAAAEQTIFQSEPREDSPASIADHVVQGSTIMPGSGFTEMGFAAAKTLFGPGRYRIEDLTFQQALFLGKLPRRVQMVISDGNGGRHPYRIYSRPLDTPDEAGWELHATGTIVHVREDAAPNETVDLNAIRAAGVRHRTHEDFYDIMSGLNLQYGPTYRILDGLTQGTDTAIATMRLHDDVVEQLKTYDIPPAIGDGAMHAAGGTVPVQSDGSFTPYTYLPVAIRSVELLEPITGDLVAVARRTSPDASESPEKVVADVDLTDADGRVVVRYRGATLRRLAAASEEATRSDPGQWLYRLGWRSTDDDVPDLTAAGDSSLAEHFAGADVVVLNDRSGVGDAVADRLAPHAARVIVVDALADGASPNLHEFTGDSGATVRCAIDPASSEQFDALVSRVQLDPARQLAIIHTMPLDVPAIDDDAAQTGEAAIATSRRLAARSTLNLYRALSTIPFTTGPVVLNVTRGGAIVGDADPVSPLGQELIGIARVAALELGAVITRSVDLDPVESVDRDADALIAELLIETNETQIAFRDGKRLGGRIERMSISDADSALPSGPYRLTISGENTIESLRYTPYRRTPPGAGEVELAVEATGLNFSDVLKSLGLYPGLTDDVIPVGIECAGVVTAIGDGVTRLAVGDEVMGIVPHGFASHCVTTESALVHRPDAVDPEEAAAIPIAFMTAYHCLVEVARLRAGERVLIHAGAGGVGLAAIQIAQDIGAEIYSTAGSDEKRDHLRSIGVEHVFDSRSIEFADQIRDLTHGEGVDVVLNSLPGDAIDHSIGVLAEGGRFVEIGKVDIYQNKMIGLLPFSRGLSYTTVDLDAMFRRRPEQSRQLLTDVMAKFDDGSYVPPDVTVFETDGVVDAFRYMQRRKNIGKIVVTMQPTESSSDDPTEVRGDASYLVTGGLGDLGLRVARWLAHRGAGAVVLLSRREPSESAREQIAAIKSDYVDTNIVAMTGDVSRRESLDAMLRQIDDELPTLRGIIHAAGVVEQKFIAETDPAVYDKVVASKIEGGWNLHRATRTRDLDFMVLFSSVSTIVGTIQQSAYGAANAFLDGLAHHRRKLGLPATAINWGPWADVGMAARSGSDLSSRGNLPLPPSEALDLMGELVRGGHTQATVMIADWPKFIRAYEALGRGGVAPPLFADFQTRRDDDGEAVAQAQRMHAKLMAMSVTQRRAELQQYLAGQVAQIMGLEPEDLDINQSLNTMGLDSLMAIELANKLQLTLQVSLPMSIFIENPTIKSLAVHSADAMGGGGKTDETDDDSGDSTPGNEVINDDVGTDASESMATSETSTTIDEVASSAASSSTR